MALNTRPVHEILVIAEGKSYAVTAELLSAPEANITPCIVISEVLSNRPQLDDDGWVIPGHTGEQITKLVVSTAGMDALCRRWLGYRCNYDEAEDGAAAGEDTPDWCI
jgi:hypothetical protein